MNDPLDRILKDAIMPYARAGGEGFAIDPDTDLINDLGLDSILVVNLFVDLEDRLGIRIGLEDITAPILNRYRDFYDFMVRMTGQRDGKEGRREHGLAH